MTPRKQSRKSADEVVLQRAPNGLMVTMPPATVRALGGAEAARAAVAVIAKRASVAACQEPEPNIVKRIRLNPAAVAQLLQDVATFHSEIPDLRGLIEDRLSELPSRKPGRPRKDETEKLADYRSFEAVRAYLKTLFQKKGSKAPARDAHKIACKLLNMDPAEQTVARNRRALRARDRIRGGY